MLGTYKGKKLEIFLGNTDNPYLREYRKEFHNHPIRVLFKEITLAIKIKCLYLLCQRDIRKAYKRRNTLDKEWIKTEIKRFRRKKRIAEHSTKVVPILINNQLSCIDEKIALTIFSLNNLGIKTSFCCHGHENLKYNFCAYISLSKGYKFPTDLLNTLEKNGVKYDLIYQKKENSYGESLYPANFKEFNEPFVMALNEWATKKNNLTLFELRNNWKS